MTDTDTAKKELVMRFVEEFWNQGDLSAADRLMTSDVLIHQPEVDGVAGFKAYNSLIRSAFPDWTSTPEELVVEGDTVVERWTGRGSHKGELMGIAATERQVAVPGVVFYRVVSGKIAEFRGFFDQMSMFQQLGVKLGQ
jgi:steroid delta-isomerase-like uncharacterized protein